MTKKESLEKLKLSPSATTGDMEKAYKRLVRRYPPEFHPEKFREVDEAYRFLTSLPYLLESLLSPEIEKTDIDPKLFEFSLSPPSSLEEALTDIEKQFRMNYLWSSPEE